MPVINGQVFPVRPLIPALSSSNTTSYTTDDAVLSDIPSTFPNVPPYPNPAGGSPVPFLRPVGFPDNEAWRLYLGKGFAVALDRAAFAARGVDGLEPDASVNPANRAFGQGMAGQENIWWASQGVWGPTLQKYASRFLAGQPLFVVGDFPVPSVPGGGAQSPVADTRIAQLQAMRVTTDQEIAALDSTYARPGVPDELVVAFGSVTLAGAKWGLKVRANLDGQRIWPGSPRVYPEAQAAEGFGTAQIFPPPDGYIRLVSDWTDFEFQSTKPQGIWMLPAGARSYFEAPRPQWRNGQPIPAPYSHPNPKLYFGPVGSYQGPNPETGADLDADPNRDIPGPVVGPTDAPPPPAPPAPAPPGSGVTLPAPKPDDNLSAPVGGSNPGTTPVAVDTWSLDPDQRPGPVSSIAAPVGAPVPAPAPAGAAPAGSRDTLVWAGLALLALVVVGMMARPRSS